MTSWIIEISNLAGTESLGLTLGPLLFPGAVVALQGQLGAGKTHFTRAVAMGLQIRNANAVTSPTFVLIQEYKARLPIYHFDAYRLSGEREFADLGAEEYLHGDGVCLIEWADRVETALPPHRLEIEIEMMGEDHRRFTMTATGEQYEDLLKAWHKASINHHSTS